MAKTDPQISFRIKSESEREDFAEALKKQEHVSSASAFFQSVMKSVKAASDRGELIEWPVELVTKKKR